MNAHYQRTETMFASEKAVQYDNSENKTKHYDNKQCLIKKCGNILCAYDARLADRKLACHKP